MSLPANKELIDQLGQSKIYNDYERAFGEATGLPLTLRPVDDLHLAHHGKRHENPFCALMAQWNRTCAACLNAQQKTSDPSAQEPQTVMCFAGLCESAVPLRAGGNLLGFLQTGEVMLRKPTRTQTGFEIKPETEDAPKYAFIGVRSCELHAIATQGKVFMGQFIDPVYRARREKAFIVAVNCGQAGGTCFCFSMNTGPKAQAGFDLALTELLEDGRHVFLVEIATKLGAEVMADVPMCDATGDDLDAAERVVRETAAHMGRTMDTSGIKELLYRNYEHPRWDNVANRCLTCANCTMVCPTSFCSTVEDTTDLTGDHAERWRRWDSCFTTELSQVVGGAVRKTARSRYRHWMTHKLATWIDQFGTSGCVGCGRCITWCPVAIDITEEVKAIRDSERHRGGVKGIQEVLNEK